MPTSEDIEQAATDLSALLAQLPDGSARHNALAHLEAVAIYARQAMSQDDEAITGQPATTASDDAGPAHS
jgi:hypothetical protein